MEVQKKIPYDFSSSCTNNEPGGDRREEGGPKSRKYQEKLKN